MEYLKLTRQEINDFWRIFRSDVAAKYDGGSVFNHNDYDKYYQRKFQQLAGWYDIRIVEEHEDFYYYQTSQERAEAELRTGMVRCGLQNYHHWADGRIKIYPVGSGKKIDDSDGVVVVFRTNTKHMHRVYTNNEFRPLGEILFVSDVELNEAKILTIEELNNLVERNWNAKEGLNKYYGVKECEMKPEYETVTVEHLPRFLDEFILNANFMCEDKLTEAKSF